jgi:hypothetical protein
MFATQLQLQTNAIFIGEPTGQGPIFFGGPTLIELPNSHLEFTVSTHLTIAGLPFDERDAIFPDIPIEYTHNDFLKGRDPVLEAALVYKSPEQMVLSIPEVDLEKYTGRYLLNEVQIVDIDRNDNKLCVHFSDYIPNSDFTFLSDLYPTSNNIFKTKLAGVHIEFPKSLPAKPESLLLYWMGSKKILYRAPKDYVSAFEKISQGDIDTGCADIKERRELYLDRYPDLESILNRLGYVHLRHDSVNTALKIFQLNVDLFPQSYNVYDSYGEALMVDGRIDLSIQNYKKSLELNPDNKNAERVIKILSEQFLNK